MVKLEDIPVDASVTGTEEVLLNDNNVAKLATVNDVLAKQHDHNVSDIQATSWNVIVARSAWTAWDMGEVSLWASKLVGRWSTGNVAEISLGESLVMSTTTLQRAALTGAITASADSNTTSLWSFTVSELNTALSDGDIVPAAWGTFTGDIVVPAETYWTWWDGSNEAPTKNDVYDKIEAAVGNRVLKTATTQRTSTTTLTSDSDLQFSVSANTKYTFRWVVLFWSNSTPDFKFSFTWPSSPTLLAIRRSVIQQTTTSYESIMIDTAYWTSVTVHTTTGQVNVVEFTGTLHNGDNAGTFAFQRAQNASNVAVTEVYAWSFIEYISF